nr:hypothetical protein CFP56_73601 [Quercus suber]
MGVRGIVRWRLGRITLYEINCDSTMQGMVCEKSKEEEVVLYYRFELGAIKNVIWLCTSEGIKKGITL